MLKTIGAMLLAVGVVGTVYAGIAAVRFVGVFIAIAAIGYGMYAGAERRNW